MNVLPRGAQTTWLRRLFFVGLLGGAGCKQAVVPEVHEAPQAATNRIAVPETVRRNLGIQFVKVERRRVAQTLRFPGHFELLPTARHELRTPMPGRVTLLVKALQTVKAGDVIARLDSPTWRAMQRDLGEIATQVRVHEARIAAMQPLEAAHRFHEESLQAAVTELHARTQTIEATIRSVGGQARELSEARAALAQMRASHAEAIEKRAEHDATLAELHAHLAAGKDRLQLALEGAAAIVTLPVASLLAVAPGSSEALPHWRLLAGIDVRAPADGIVDQLPVANGGWVETGGLLGSMRDVTQVRFRARGLQSDLPRLRNELPARAIPAASTSDVTAHLAGTLLLGPEADPDQRTIDLFLECTATVPWARPGVSGFLEVETASGAAAELAIPRAATLQDGMTRVLFRRDPADPDKVIRLEADLGIDDGRWVEVKSGLRDGDEVVLAGAYELMLASSGSAAKGGHFHADGTFHDGEHK